MTGKLEPLRPVMPVIRQQSSVPNINTVQTPSKPVVSNTSNTSTIQPSQSRPSTTQSNTTINTSTNLSTSKNLTKPPQKPKPEKKTPLEILYMRRASVREQKRQSIVQNIQYFPAKFIYGQMAILGFLALAMISVQIAIIVEQTSLYYLLSGFWCGGVLIMCVVYLFLLELTRSHRNFIICFTLHVVGFFASLGLVIINSIDMALFNVQCILACFRFSYQFLGLILVILGSIAIIDFAVFVFGVDYFILRESRAINAYLENKKQKRKF